MYLIALYSKATIKSAIYHDTVCVLKKKADWNTNRLRVKDRVRTGDL
jgi:hypothetical protein